jgi:hypothetical protein
VPNAGAQDREARSGEQCLETLVVEHNKGAGRKEQQEGANSTQWHSERRAAQRVSELVERHAK